MINIKKIGMTALAASLVSTSAYAGALTASGSASLTVDGYAGGTGMNAGTGFTQGNSITLSGGGELENGLTVTLSYELDQDAAANTASPFDDHSVTLSSDALGTFKFSGHGGASASSSIGLASGIWDNFDGTNTGGGTGSPVAMFDSAPGEDSLFYTSPSIVEGLSIFASYKPQSSSQRTSDSEIGLGLTYTGIAGLSLSYADSAINGAVTADQGDHKVMSGSYAYGPITFKASDNKVKVGTGVATMTALDVDNSAQDTRAYSLSYTVSEAISISYGLEKIESPASGAQDAEYSGISASWTGGGMSVSAGMYDAVDTEHSTNAREDMEYWSLGASFAF